MPTRLEHANLCVKNIDSMIQFLQNAFSEFRIRADRTDPDGTRWVHIGIDETYIALNKANPGEALRGKPYSGRIGLNHLGFEIDDAAALRERMLAAGYEESTPPNAHPYRIRVYFYDPEGNDWEFVQYLSDDVAERHDYDSPEQL